MLRPLALATLLLLPLAPTAAAESMYCRDVADGLPYGHPVDPRQIGQSACRPVDRTIGTALCLLPPDVWAPCGIGWWTRAEPLVTLVKEAAGLD